MLRRTLEQINLYGKNYAYFDYNSNYRSVCFKITLMFLELKVKGGETRIEPYVTEMFKKHPCQFVELR